jgi:hypothetical protein
MFNTTAIATKLNIAASAIIKIEEWTHVLFVRFKGGCRFVSKKVGCQMKRIGLTGYELPEFAPQFDDEDEEYDWLCDWHQQKEDQAVGEIAKLLPVGADPSSRNVDLVAAKVANGDMTVEEAVASLTSKRPILRK